MQKKETKWRSTKNRELREFLLVESQEFINVKVKFLLLFFLFQSKYIKTTMVKIRRLLNEKYKMQIT